MKLGIFAKTFAGTEPTVVLQAASEAGYQCVQYNWACAGLPSMPDAIPRQSLAGTRSAVQSTGVSLAALSGTYNMTHPDANEREVGLRRLNIVIDSAAELDIPIVTLCTGSRDAEDQWREHPDNDSDAAWSDLMRAMEQAVRMAEAAGVSLGVEPELANTVNSADKALKLMQAFDAETLCIVLDPANLFEVLDDDARRTTIASAIEQLAPWIRMGHAKDRLADGHFCTAGDGVVDFHHYLAALKSIGFDGPMITHGLPADDAVRVAGFLEQRLAALS